MKKNIFTLFILAIPLLFFSCNDEHFNHKVIVEDNVSLLQKATKDSLLSYKCPDDVIIAIHTTGDTISHGKLIKFADGFFDDYADSIKDFKRSGILILTSNNPTLIQMRVGENFRLMAQNYGIYPGKEYYGVQQSAYTYGPDYAVMQMFKLAVKCGEINAELSFAQRSNQNKAANTIYDLLSGLTTPKDSFFFNTFLKYPFKLSFFLIKKTGSLVNMLLLILICIIVINVLIHYFISKIVQKKACLLMGIFVIIKIVAVYTFITASISAVFFIAVPAMENFILIQHFNLGDVSVLSGIYENVEMGSSVVLGIIFLVCFILMLITKNQVAVVYSSTSPDFQRRLFASLSKEEQQKLSIGNALDADVGASADDFKKNPFTAILATSMGTAIKTTGGVLLISLFLLSKPILLVLLLIVLNSLVTHIINILKINRYARKAYPQEMKNRINILLIISTTLVFVLAVITFLSFALKRFNIDYDKTKEIATTITTEDWATTNQRFLEENKNADGVITLESGLQYKVLKKGKGKKPSTTAKVKVHYTGKLIDDTVFDSTVERSEPAVFGLNQVIKGFSEALKLMTVGSKWVIYIPSEIAYGNRGTGLIKPYSTLIFEMELLEIVK